MCLERIWKKCFRHRPLGGSSREVLEKGWESNSHDRYPYFDELNLANLDILKQILNWICQHWIFIGIELSWKTFESNIELNQFLPKFELWVESFWVLRTKIGEGDQCIHKMMTKSERNWHDEEKWEELTISLFCAVAFWSWFWRWSGPWSKKLWQKVRRMHNLVSLCCGILVQKIVTKSERNGKFLLSVLWHSGPANSAVSWLRLEHLILYFRTFLLSWFYAFVLWDEM